MSTLWRAGCLVLTLAAASQLAHAEDADVQPAPAPAPTPATETAPTVAAPASEETPAASTGGFLGEYPVHGYLKSRYVGRTTDGASDNDLYETLSLDFGDVVENRVTGHFLGDVSFDLDGTTDTEGYYPFDSARDSTGSGIVGEVYSAYVDVNRIGAVGYVRLGRQSIYETPEVSFFDGLSAESEELGSFKLKLGAYAGIPVYLYQGYSSGDFIGGGYATGRLWKGARARVDFQHMEGTNGSAELSNDLIGVDGWQRLGRYVDLRGHYTNLDGADRDVLARGTFNQAEWDFRFQATFYQMFQAQQNAVIGADSYYPILKDYLPYIEGRCLVSKGIGEFLNVDAGVDVRRLSNEAADTDYNHEFERYFATIDILDLVVKGSSISLTGEKWVSAETDKDSQGLDITCPIADKSKLTVGTAHYLYKYDYYADQEKDDVQTYYLRYEYRHSRALRLSADYTYEDDSSYAQYNELRCEVICSF